MPCNPTVRNFIDPKMKYKISLDQALLLTPNSPSSLLQLSRNSNTSIGKSGSTPNQLIFHKLTMTFQQIFHHHRPSKDPCQETTKSTQFQFLPFQFFYIIHHYQNHRLTEQCLRVNILSLIRFLCQKINSYGSRIKIKVIIKHYHDYFSWAQSMQFLFRHSRPKDPLPNPPESLQSLPLQAQNTHSSHNSNNSAKEH